ncbi:MAG: MGMT family protein [Nannocystaceae bacterium]|nr:MGMT family protein [Nannocystaceae bacterium]
MARSIAPEPRVVGPGFHARVFAVVRQVPAGQVTTYGQIATLLGSPRVARQVGFAMAGASHSEQDVPWHRVINAQGAISDRGDFERAQEQRHRLEAEGVEFNERGRVDLSRFRCTFPDFVWPAKPIDPD